jgi:hypothetical protein
MPALPAAHDHVHDHVHDHAHPPLAAVPAVPRVPLSWLQAGAGWRFAAVAAMLAMLALVVYGSLAR